MRVGPPLPSGSVVFCDDIRREEGGKRSLMGVYMGSMNFPVPPPSRLASFCALITWRMSPEDLPSQVKFCMFKDDANGTEEVFSVEINLPNSPPLPTKNLFSADNDSPFAVEMAFEARLPGLEFKSDSRLRVRAFIADAEHRIGSLDVNFLAQPSPPSGS